jgi:hypothetical protein
MRKSANAMDLIRLKPPAGGFWQVFFSEAESEPPRSICFFIEESGF